MTTTDTMKLRLDGITLQVEDVEQSLNFYRRIPGTVLEHDRLGEFAPLRIGQARLGLLAFGAPSFHLEISADDVDQLHLQLRDAGMKPAWPPNVPNSATSSRRPPWPSGVRAHAIAVSRCTSKNAHRSTITSIPITGSFHTTTRVPNQMGASDEETEMRARSNRAEHPRPPGSN